MARATVDIDLAVVLGADPVSLAAHLQAIYHPGDHDDPLQGVFRMDLTVGETCVPVQLIVLRPQWTEVVFRDIKTVSLLDCPVPVVNWPALVLLKLYAGGPVGLQDARDILAVGSLHRLKRVPLPLRPERWDWPRNLMGSSAPAAELAAIQKPSSLRRFLADPFEARQSAAFSKSGRRPTRWFST